MYLSLLVAPLGLESYRGLCALMMLLVKLNGGYLKKKLNRKKKSGFFFHTSQLNLKYNLYYIFKNLKIPFFTLE